MKKAWNTLVQFFSILFGHWQWTPPGWIQRTQRKISQSAFGKKICSKCTAIKSDPRLAMKWGGVVAGVLIAIGASVFFIQQYYEGLPEPDYASVSIEAPYPATVHEKTVSGLTLLFSKSVAPLEMVDKEIVDGISMSPDLKGKWKWSSDKSITFTPEGAEAFKTDWLVGTEYEISFRKKIFAPHVELKEYEIKFSTPRLTLYASKQEFYIDPRNEKIKRVIFNLTANTPLDTEDFKKRLALTLQPVDDSLLGKSGTAIKYKVTFNEHNTQAFIESETIELPKANHVAKITVQSGLQSRRGGEGLKESFEEKVDVPGLYEALKIEDPKIIFARNEKYEPEQVLVFGTVIDVKPENIEKSISVELLPADHTNPVTKKLVKNYPWSSASEVTESVRKELAAVKWTLLPGLHPQNSQHSVRIEAPVHRYVLLKIKEGVRGIGGYVLKHSYSTVLRVPNYTPELLFMSEGSILTLSGDRKLPVLSRNVKGIKYEIGRVLPSHSNILIARLAESSTFSKPSMYGDIEDSIMERFEEKSSVTVQSRSATNYTSLDLNPYIKGIRGFYYVKAYRLQPRNEEQVDEEYGSDGAATCSDDEGCEGVAESEPVDTAPAEETSDGYYQMTDRRLVMITDLGIIAKTTNTKKTIVYVQNLATGLPVTDAHVSVLGLNGISILETRTDSVGRAEISDLATFTREKRPIAIMARKNDDFAYLPYNTSERELSFSRFDVGGIHDDASSEAINAMLFSDRELYRPGETANIGILLRSQTGGKAHTLPFTISITDPRGQTVKTEAISATMFGIKDYQFKSSETSPTGTYTITLSTAPKKGKYPTQVGTVDIRVEEFVPDKLRISAQMEPAKAVGWIPLDRTKFNVSLNNLFGSPAENRVVKPELSLVPVTPSVAKFKGYTFINPNSNDAKTATEFLAESKTDTKGATVFEVDLSKYKGFFSIRFGAEGFEAEGGRSVSAVAGGYASQLKHLVGYKADGSLSYISVGAGRKVDLVAINSQFEADSIEVTAQLVLNEFVSSLVKQDDGSYKYQSVKKEKPLKTEKWKIGAKGHSIELPSTSAGLHTYVITDSEGNELNRFDFNIVGDTNLTRSLDRNSELQLTLSKDDFAAGEEIEVNIIAPYAGAGLITIERDTVYAQKWFQTSTNSTTQRIRIPDTFTGNGYINVSFLRAHDSKEIYMSPLSYGVLPFTVNVDRVKTTINITSPDKVKPGGTLEVSYSSSQPTSMILYGVDEGIVSAARYKLPDPIKHYFKKRALQVSTYQLLDLLLPEYSLLKQSYAPGGDASESLLGANLNPFKRKGLPPVVFWSGVIKTDTTKKTFKYQVPEHFNGNIKIYAIANSEKGIGSSTHQALARADFVISPTPPLFVSPSDEFEVGVLVSNQSEGKGQKEELDISVKPSKHVQLTTPPKITMTIPQGREMGTSFRFKATENLGAADIQFTATNGTLTSSLAQSLSVRPATPYVTTSVFDMTTKTNVDLSLTRVLYEEFAKTNLTVAASPVAMAVGLFRYLDDYQFLCTEQLISMTIPHVFLPETKLSKKDVSSAGERHLATINMLRTRQTGDGGFALYGGGSTDVPASLYAILYLVESNERGLAVPGDLLEQARIFVSSQAVQDSSSLARARLFAQALYLQARLGLVPGSKLNFLREKLEKDYKDDWKNDISAIWIAGTYALVQKQDAGWAILKNVDLKAPSKPDYAYFYDNNVRMASLIHVAASQFPDKISSYVNSDTLSVLTKELVAGRYNTHSAARMIMAFAPYQKYADQKGFPGALKIFEKIAGKESELKSESQEILDIGISPKATGVSLKESPVTPYFYALSVSGFDKALPKEELKQGIESHRTVSSTKIKQGDELSVSTKIRSIKDDYIPHVVVIDLFPAGFELIIDSVEQTGLEYVDKREDRVVMYLNANKDMAEVKYRLKAVNKGKFVLPPLNAESMYDKGIVYRGAAQSIEIL